MNRPAGSVEGDVLLAVIAHQEGSRRDLTPPSGWTAVPSTDRANSKWVRIHAWFKVAGASEPSSYTFALTGGAADISGGLLAVSGAGPSPINASGSQTNGGPSASVSAPSITTTAASSLLVFGGACNDASSFTAPAGMSEEWDRASTGSAAVATETATAGFPNPGATGTRTATASSSCRSVGLQVAISP